MIVVAAWESISLRSTAAESRSAGSRSEKIHSEASSA
jgi:hypothetical protein